MDPFDELAQALARGVSRRQALRRFAIGLSSAMIATLLPWRSLLAVASTPRLFMSGTDVSGADVSGASVSMLPSIRIGASGPKVETIQYLLRQNGSDLDVDGDFGGQTDQAVRAFQRKNFLTVDGVVGPETWGALFVNVQAGDQGDAVSAVQTLLNAAGINVAVDGSFGDQTLGAVRSFQQANGLTLDGIVGPQTWGGLLNN